MIPPIKDIDRKDFNTPQKSKDERRGEFKAVLAYEQAGDKPAPKPDPLRPKTSLEDLLILAQTAKRGPITGRLHTTGYKNPYERYSDRPKADMTGQYVFDFYYRFPGQQDFRQQI